MRGQRIVEVPLGRQEERRVGKRRGGRERERRVEKGGARRREGRGGVRMWRGRVVDRGESRGRRGEEE